ncbi:MAG: hypothetical protein ACP5VS_04430 [Desulfomonilaceae bacterium]
MGLIQADIPTKIADDCGFVKGEAAEIVGGDTEPFRCRGTIP